MNLPVRQWSELVQRISGHPSNVTPNIFLELFSFPFCLLRQKYGKANSRGSDRIFSYANTFGNVFVLKTGKQRNSRRVGIFRGLAVIFCCHLPSQELKSPYCFTRRDTSHERPTTRVLYLAV